MFSRSVRLFAIYGTGIKLDSSWLLFAALIIWSLSHHYFPGQLPTQPAQIHLMISGIALIGVLGSLMLHELGHSIVGEWRGLPPVAEVTLMPFGGVADHARPPAPFPDALCVALAGPAMSFTLGIGFWGAARMAPLFDLHAAVIELLSALAAFNLALALFNLLPAQPLDGGQISQAYVGRQSGDPALARTLAARSGTFLGYGLLSGGVVALFAEAIVVALWLMLVGSCVLTAARMGPQLGRTRSLFDTKPVRAVMTRNPITVEPDMTLEDLAEQIILKHRVSFVPVVESGVLLGHIDQAILSHIDRENWSGTRVGDVFIGLDPLLTVTEDDLAQDLILRIYRSGHRKFLVTEGGRLKGVVSLADLTPHLSGADPATPRRAGAAS